MYLYNSLAVSLQNDRKQVGRHYSINKLWYLGSRMSSRTILIKNISLIANILSCFIVISTCITEHSKVTGSPWSPDLAAIP